MKACPHYIKIKSLCSNHFNKISVNILTTPMQKQAEAMLEKSRNLNCSHTILQLFFTEQGLRLKTTTATAVVVILFFSFTQSFCRQNSARRRGNGCYRSSSNTVAMLGLEKQQKNTFYPARAARVG